MKYRYYARTTGRLTHALIHIATLIIVFYSGHALWPHSVAAGPQTKGDFSFGSGQVIDAVNAVRTSHGLPALKENESLDASAYAYATYMCANNVWAHGDWRTSIKAHGYNYSQAGENLAFGSSTLASFIETWVNSPDHYANIVNTQYTDTGVGVLLCTNVYQGLANLTIVVQHFGQLPPAPAAPTPAPVTSAPKPLKTCEAQ